MGNIVLYIAKKYLFSRKGNYSFVNINTIVSILGVAFGLSALIIVLSVFNGFQEMTTDVLKDEKPLYRLSNLSYGEYEKLGISKGFLYIEEKVVVKQSDGFSVKKLLTIHNDDALKNSLGIYDSSGHDNLYLMGSDNGFFFTNRDYLEFAYLESVEKFSQFGFYDQMTRMKINNTFAKGVENNTLLLVTSNIDKFQNDSIKLQVDVFQELTDSQLNFIDDKEINKLTWQQMNSDILFILELEKIFSGFVMFMIVCIGLFNLLAAISMLLTVKKIDFHTLGVLGLDLKKRRQVIYSYGLIVITIGSILGLFIGIGFVLLQNTFNLIPINIDGSIVDYLPITLNINQLIVAILGVYLLGLLAISVPSSQISNKIYNWE